MFYKISRQSRRVLDNIKCVFILLWKMSKKVRLSMINLGCNKNLVDSQLFLWKLLSENIDNAEYFSNPYDKNVEIVLLNTCSFISSWREEMFKTVDKLISLNKKVCIIWCGVQYFEKLLKTRNVLDDVSKSELNRRETLLQNNNIFYLSWNDLSIANLKSITSRSNKFNDFCRYSAPRLLTNYENRYEYLKIAEWCNNSCAFCIIPQIRWKLTSLPIQKVVKEAESLLQQWVEELIIVAQDTMRYWTDYSSKSQLLPLLHQLDKLPYDFKYRILYLYPDILTLKQLEDFATLEKFIPYFDIPLQHISPKLLKSMWRFYDDKMIHLLLKWIRKLFPKAFIRTNIIIWFPWETDEDVELLERFLDEDYFDNIALFEYHDEPLALSSIFENKVPESTIHSRFNVICRQVDKLLKSHEKKRKSENQIWFVEGIEQKNNKINLTIRPEVNCPEIDPVDNIKLDNVIQCFDWDEIDIWSKVEYLLN